ncbi:MAG: CYTH domain-containing protein [Burkholderiaceae bacterium]|nr:CYTH domain-containing protein [Burkholderiaceae bacterium]
MGVEIERKFLLADDSWRTQADAGHIIRQGYLCSDPMRLVRVRVMDEQAFITVKRSVDGLFRNEWEYAIPLADAREMLDNLCERPLIEKVRYHVVHAGMLWEIDEFDGENAGLRVAEIELASVDQVFDPPAWLGREVTADKRYYNASLVQYPYQAWRSVE